MTRGQGSWMNTHDMHMGIILVCNISYHMLLSVYHICCLMSVLNAIHTEPCARHNTQFIVQINTILCQLSVVVSALD